VRLVSVLLVAAAATATVARAQATGPAPREITASAYLADLVRVTGSDQSFVADLVLRLEWQDPTLADPEGGTRTLPAADIGWPGLQVVNERDVDRMLPEAVEVGADGTVLYRQRYMGVFSTRMDLRDFPLDRQRLSIELVLPGVRAEDVRFVLDPDDLVAVEQPTVADWRLLGFTGEPSTFEIRGAGRASSSLTLSIDIGRKLGFWVGKAFASVAVIVLMSWVVFWIEPEQLNPRVSVTVTSMLTLIAYRFLLGQDLPRISYLTRLDHFLLGSTVLVFLALVQVATCSRLLAADRADAAVRLNFHSRWLFPLGYALLFAAVFVR
jgi:hypothetical protein